jgi:hypothetical protein
VGAVGVCVAEVPVVGREGEVHTGVLDRAKGLPRGHKHEGSGSGQGHNYSAKGKASSIYPRQTVGGHRMKGQWRKSGVYGRRDQGSRVSGTTKSSPVLFLNLSEWWSLNSSEGVKG